MAADRAHVAERVGLMWIRIWRGAGGSGLREYLFGTGPEAIELSQVHILALLNTRGATRMRELADSLGVDPSTATRTVDRLVRSGLVARQVSTDDKRVVEVVPTGAGRERYRRHRLRRRELMAHMLGAFDEHEQEQLADFLERFVAAADQFVEQRRAVDDAVVRPHGTA